MTNKIKKSQTGNEKLYLRAPKNYAKNIQWRIETDYELKLSNDDLIWLRKFTEAEYGGNATALNPEATQDEKRKSWRDNKRYKNDGLSNLIAGKKTTDVYSVQTIRKSHGKNYQEDATNELFHFRHMTARHKKAA